MLKTIYWLAPIISPQAGKCRWHEYMNQAGWPLVYLACEPNEELNEEALRDLKESPKPDLIFATSDSVVEATLQLKRIYKVPAVIYVWGYLPERVNSIFFADSIFQKLNKIKKIDRVLSCSNYTGTQLANLGIPNQVIYPGIDLDLIDSIKEVPKRPDRIIAISRLVPHKRLDKIIIAVSLIPKSRRPKLLIIGTGSEREFLKCLARRAGVSLEIKQQKDNREKFQELLSEGTLCLVTASEYEGLGLVPLEAMYCRKPVFASDIPSHREVLINHAEYVDCISGLARRLEEEFYSFNRATKAELEERRDYVQKYFSWRASVQNLNSVLKEL